MPEKSFATQAILWTLTHSNAKGTLLAMSYNPKSIEPKWQNFWKENQTFRAEIDPTKPKYYVLDMFPYPSGDGLHVGHPEGYTATDILARYKRMRGFNVLHPMGWDAFGLPAEQYAIKTGTHPRITTKRNIENFRRQIESLGFSYDWSREVDTTDPKYVKWTQWIFIKLFEMGLAYEAEVPVNWCPALGTVLANEEVIDGKSEIGGHPVVRMPMKQWMLRITKYADRLLEDLETLDWPEAIKKQQRDWIGRSEGARIRFAVEGHADLTIEVFTTRPDTLFGVSCLILAPEHPLVARITPPAQRAAIHQYVEESSRKSERLRLAEVKEKTGVDTGARALHPCTGETLPIWIADYVLTGYGTGAIMSVPAHDERDFAFAKTFGLPIRCVIHTSDGKAPELPFTSSGVAVHSEFLDGLETEKAKSEMNRWLESNQCGETTITYKLRDWLFSRQRYWGEPFPLLKHSDGSVTTVPLDELPVLLPEVEDYRPKEGGKSPLDAATQWLRTRDPRTGAEVLRETNTMPQWAGSCWYFLRFCDPQNENAAWSQEAERYWMPVDLYVGGAEHAVLHLLYARFWHKVFYDLGLVHTKEPFQKLVNQGMILGFSYRYYDDDLEDRHVGNPAAPVQTFSYTEVRFDGERALAHDGKAVKARWVKLGDVRWATHEKDRKPMHPQIEGLELEEVIEKMSKSRGNVINPDQVVDEFGADSMRLYEMFIGPLEKSAPWSTEGIQGVHRFLQKVHRLFLDEDNENALKPLSDGSGSVEQQRLTAKTIAEVTHDLETMQFNTAISKLMVFVRDIAKDQTLPRASAHAFVLLLAPFAPHLAEELWQKLGNRHTLAYEPWPLADAALLVADRITLAVQINGKRRDEIEVPANADDAEIQRIALASERVQKHLDGKTPHKVIVVKGRLLNIVV